MGDKALAASHPLDEVIPGSCKDTVRRGRGEEGNASLCQIAFETQGLTHKTGIYLCMDLSIYVLIYLPIYLSIYLIIKVWYLKQSISAVLAPLGWLDF